MLGVQRLKQRKIQAERVKEEFFFHHSIFDPFHFDRKTIGKICPMYNMLNYPNFDSIDAIEISFKVRIRD